MRTLLDASAILALLQAEPGADSVAAELAVSAVSSVNLAEVVGKLVDHGQTVDRIIHMLDALALRILPLEEDVAVRAGELRAATRHIGLSLGDRACLATAETLGLRVMTTDRAWARLDLGVEVIVIR
jgi:PIN domain nuclease of toxin-antitoxin system